MSASNSSRDLLLERLAQDFVERHRRGERPLLSDYTDRHPELAADIRELFPALVQLEHLKPIAGDLTGPFAGVAADTARGQPDRAGDRPRRHGCRLRGRAGVAGPARGAEGTARPGPAGCEVPTAVPAGSPVGGPAASHQYCPGLRRGRTGRPTLLRHAVHPG